jgi:ATP-dependent exoDNAse (exonuclease V) alpha subunit
MQHRHIHEAVDRTFRDLRSSDRPFGGVTVVFGGDFQQILPVIVRGSRAQTVSACMQRSTLWGDTRVLHLKLNMRLDRDDAEERNFAKWQLEVGHGQHTGENGNILLPDHFRCTANTIPALVDTIYPGIHDPQQHSDQYFSERTILSSRNDDVDELNTYILNKFPGEARVYHSADSLPNNTPEQQTEGELMYPVEYLNTINCSGLPLAQLALKVGCPVMVLRNLNPRHGVCNGSRGIITRMGNRVLEIRLLTGDHAGERVLIPRITIRPTDDQVPFEFTRRQFPVRLAFAMTINKAQGQSVKHVGLDLRTPVFAHGQFYVAISRVTSKHNIKAIWTSTSEHPLTKNIVYSEVLLDTIGNNVV